MGIRRLLMVLLLAGAAGLGVACQAKPLVEVAAAVPGANVPRVISPDSEPAVAATATEARLEIRINFPVRQVQVIPSGTAQVVLTLSGAAIAAPVIATVTPPPDRSQPATRIFAGLRQGVGYTLEAEAQNSSGTALASVKRTEVSLLSGNNALGLEMNLTATKGAVNF